MGESDCRVFLDHILGSVLFLYDILVGIFFLDYIIDNSYFLLL